jgi:hypothetical protein
MLINRESLPRHLGWLAVFLAGTAAATVAYVAAGRAAPRWPGGSSPVGLVLGVLAAVLMLFEVLLWPRKKLRAWRLGTARAWMRAHIWLGFLTVPLVVLHSGFSLGGRLSASLMLLFGLVVVSGVVGLVLQQFLPRMMLERVPAETIHSQIGYFAEQSYWDAEDLIAAACGEPAGPAQSLRPRPQEAESARAFVTVGTVRSVGSVGGKVLQTQVPVTAAIHGEALREAFFNTIGRYLLEGRQSGSPLRAQSASAAYFRGLRDRLPEEAAGAIDALEGFCDQRRQFDLQSSLHGWLHGWLCIHVPLSVALVLLMFVHIVVALKYW